MKTLNLTDIDVVEFGVCFRNGKRHEHHLVPVDLSVQAALKEMLQATHERWKRSGDASENYDPAQEYGSDKRLVLSLQNHPIVDEIKQLYTARNIPNDSNALRRSKDIYYYFARFMPPAGVHVNNKEPILAIRRGTFFKGLASHKNALVRWLDDSLTIIQDPVFKFDLDFDFYIQGNDVLILRPKAFELIACMDDVITEKVEENVEAIQKALPFLGLTEVSEYAKKHKRSSRLLSALVARDDLSKVSEPLLSKACEQNGVKLTKKNGKVSPESGQEEAFLRVLDRRRYTVELIKKIPETYDASSRKRAE